MKTTDNIEKYSDKEWTELASILSEEKIGNNELMVCFTKEDNHDTTKHWKDLANVNDEKEINIDKAWENVSSRLKDKGLMPETGRGHRLFIQSRVFRYVAVFLLLLGTGTILVVLNKRNIFSPDVTVVTESNQKNLQVILPDGSNVILNRNTTLGYKRNFGKYNRQVTLNGEAFFEISADYDKPFEVETETARITVSGTSFNVITSNTDAAVEVYVKTGRVRLNDHKGSKDLVIDPGYVGTMDRQSSGKYINNDRNYLAWTDGILIYDGQRLDVVFRDLQKVYNMEIVAENPGILEYTWTTNGPLNNQPEETIIRLICLSFNLSYSKSDNVYHLSGK